MADMMVMEEDPSVRAPRTAEEKKAIAAMTSPWIEKYRPDSLKDIIAHQDIMTTRE